MIKLMHRIKTVKPLNMYKFVIFFKVNNGFRNCRKHIYQKRKELAVVLSLCLINKKVSNIDIT